MANSSAICNVWKRDLGIKLYNHTVSTDSWKCALYTSAASLGAGTTGYSATNEVAGTGYTATGVVIATVTPVLSGSTAIFDWADAQWTTSTFTANACLVYDDTPTSPADPAAFTIAFGADQAVSGGTFTIVWPTADATNAIIRIA